MNTFEKITTVIISILVVVALVFSFFEFTEGPEHKEASPDFSHSIGADFKIGTFDTLLSEQASGGLEDDCQTLQPVIVVVLHDVDVNLEGLHVYEPGVFEVNQQTLDFLCSKNASITLSNAQGGKLLLDKVPFVANTPLGNGSDDTGTKVRINAQVVLPGAAPGSEISTYGEELIPSRYLDDARH